MFSNKTNLSLWPCFQSEHLIPFSFWNFQCILCRIGGMMILFVSVICLIFNIRYFLWYQQKRCRNALVFSLFIASFLVLIISVPGVVLQLFTCHRHCNKIYCRIEGFTSYFGGCLCMLIYTSLSIQRYLLLSQYECSLFHYYSTVICWILSITWTLPPVFDYWISYVPEGLGFHCSIDWNDHSTISFCYIFSSFLGMYFVPLILLLIVNIYAYKIIRNTYSYSNQEISNKNKLSLFKQQTFIVSQKLNTQTNITYCYIKQAADRKRLKIEYRFMQAIIFLVSAYIFAWTPYSIIALLQLFHVDFIFKHASFITLSALIAKLSVIVTPLVYLRIMNGHLFKKILF